MNIERDARIYQIKNNTDYKFILLMQNQLKEWSLTGFGWESDLYKEIGKRSADIENGYLQSNKIVKQTMESYVEYYEKMISNPSTYESLLTDFHVTVQINMGNIPKYLETKMTDVINSFGFYEKGKSIYELVTPSSDLLLTYGIQEEFISIAPKVTEEFTAGECNKEEIPLRDLSNLKQLQLF